MKKKTVFVGLSGGVDSSVSAALLKKRGFSVVGVFLKTWQPDFLKGPGVCTETADRRDAMRVAAHLRIPFLTLDCVQEYKKGVVDRMIEEYRVGRVPNPDVFCNREVKFGVFWREAKKRGADFIATGHYAQKSEIRNQKSEIPAYQLNRGADKNKDQSYFLWTLTQDDLAHALFPVGTYQKTEVRALARKFGLPTAERKDSQGICFIGKADMKGFLSHYIPSRQGNVCNTEGQVIGTHDGASFYAIGERHGFSVRTRGDVSAPLYVVAKDVQKNTITVSTTGKGTEAMSAEATISAVHWIATPPEEGKIYQAEVRYRGEPISATLEKSAGDAYTVTLAKSEFMSAGQSLVIYDGKRCLGGGIIEVAR